MNVAAVVLVAGSVVVGSTAFIDTPAARAEPSHAVGGIASHYDHAGRRTANGEVANPSGMTAAHRTLPFGTRVRVTNSKNGRTVEVRINDRGPYIRGRVIDLTTAAARALGFEGLAPVTLVVLR